MELFSYISAILNKLVSTLQLLLSHKNRPSLISKREQDWSKEDYLTKAEAAWEDLLSRIQITTTNQDEVSTFLP